MDINIKRLFIQDVAQRVNNITIKPKGGVCHETANPGATAMDHYKYVLNNKNAFFAHFYVDNKEIIQLADTTKMLFHCRGGNSQYFGVENCRPPKHDPVYFADMWANSTKLFAYLFLNKGYGQVTPDTLPSHHEITIREKIEGGHTDPDDYFKEYGKTMQDFRNDVIKLIRANKKG